MTFDAWWDALPPAEQKLIGKNNAKFVWNESRANSLNMLTLPNYTVGRTKDKVIIMSFHGEGGSFDLDAFDKTVSQFFAENF